MATLGKSLEEWRGPQKRLATGVWLGCMTQWSVRSASRSRVGPAGAHMRAGRPKDRCRAIAAKQLGLITRAQARGAGLSDSAIARMLQAGELIRIFPGVFRYGHVPASWEQRLLGAYFWAGDAVISHRSAAILWQLDAVPPAIDLYVPSRKRASAGVTLHTTRSLRDRDVVDRGRFRLTDVNRTLLDIGAVVSDEKVELALDSALRRGLTTVDRVAERLNQTGKRGREGTRVLRWLIGERSGFARPTESQIETRLFRVLRNAKLPRPVPQFQIYQGEIFIARPDFAYPERRLAIEGLSYRWHGTKDAWDHDVERLNRIGDAGWRVIFVTWRDLSLQPQVVIERIRAALGGGQGRLAC